MIASHDATAIEWVVLGIIGGFAWLVVGFFVVGLADRIDRLDSRPTAPWPRLFIALWPLVLCVVVLVVLYAVGKMFCSIAYRLAAGREWEDRR